jgi:hypothetical protein
MHISRIAALPQSTIQTGSGKTLSDACLQLSVAAPRKQELRRHSTGIVLRAASFGAGIGIGSSDCKGR